METTTEARRKERSPNFPFISLHVAIQRAQEFYNAERRGSAPYEIAAKHWRYSPSSSGALQTVAALKQYGLMTDEGAGKQRRVKLSDLALRILLDTREDSTERDEHIRMAARSPAIAQEVYSKWPDGLPSDGTLNHFLVLERGFGEHAARKVVSIIKSNDVVVQDSSDVNISVDSDNIGDSMSGTALEAIQVSAETQDSIRFGRRAPVQAGHVTPRESVIGAYPVGSNLTIRLMIDGPYTRKNIEALVRQLQLNLELDVFPHEQSPGE